MQKCPAVVENVILICISGIVSRGVRDVSSCDCGSPLWEGRQTREDSIKPVLAIPICLHVSLYRSAVSIHLRYN